MTRYRHNNVVNFGDAMRRPSRPAKRVLVNLPGLLRYVRLGDVSILTIGGLQRLRVGDSIIWQWRRGK